MVHIYRSAALVMAHLREGRVPSIEAVGRSDNALLTPLAVTPRAVFGCTVEVALQVGSRFACCAAPFCAAQADSQTGI